jgi:hypothetical protein
MRLTDEQKTALKEIFQEQSFKGYSNGKFQFISGPKPTNILNFLKNLGAPNTFEEVPCLIPLALAIHKKAIPSEEILEVVREYTEERKSSIPVADLGEGEEDSAAVASFMRSLVPAVDIGSRHKQSQEKIILLDPAKNYRPVTDIDIDSYLVMAGHTWQELLTNDEVRKVMTCFDPYRLDYMYFKESKSGTKICHVNYYVPPRWRFLDIKPEYTGFIKGLIDHLFPEEDEKEYVLDWLHYALVKRNETILCLIGSRGTGKGLLLYNILSALIGEEYHSIAKQEVLTEKFNSEFSNKRFVFFDEVNVSGEKELNKFKALANSKIAMEAKGQDSTTIDNYVSMGLSSNDKRDFRAEPQERRFSVPRVTDRPLFELYSEEEIEAFCNRIKEPESEEIAAFGNWLIQRVPVNTSQRPLKGKYYFDLCRLSMPEWKVFITDYVIENGSDGEFILLKDIERDFKRGKSDKDKVYFPRAATVQIFLGDYIHEASEKIGSIVYGLDKNGRNAPAILPNPAFLEKFGKNLEEEEEALEAL